MNSTMARNARISAAHGTTRLATSTVTPLATEIAYLDGKATIARSVSVAEYCSLRNDLRVDKRAFAGKLINK